MMTASSMIIPTKVTPLQQARPDLPGITLPVLGILHRTGHQNDGDLASSLRSPRNLILERS